MQTILGAGGAIGTELAHSLGDFTNHVRLVSRNPKAVNPSDEPFKADLTDREATSKAVKGSDIVYLTAGLKYDTETWRQQWPVIVNNTIAACSEHHAKLLFFDNIYLYSSDTLNPITEVNTIDPPSQKGLIRAQLAQMIWDAHKDGKVEAVIARAADFYGPGLRDNTSVLIETVFKPLSKNKRAFWLGNAKYKHSFTYTPDAGKATALLGNTPSAYGQEWHVPTSPNPPTGKEWIEQIARELSTSPSYFNSSSLIIRALGLFNPIMRESVEMMYQYSQDYVFSSRKFEQAFKMSPTPYETGIKEVVSADFSS